MTSSDDGRAPDRPVDSRVPRAVPGEADLLAEGWQRCFVADEPRLSEAVEAYEEIGYEVTLLPFAPQENACSECTTPESVRLAVIYVRKRESE